MMNKAIGILLVIVLIGCSQQSENKPVIEKDDILPEIPVRTALIETQPFSETIHVIGKTEAVRRGNIIFEVPGKVTSISVEANDAVKKDTELARLDAEHYDALYTLAKSSVEKARRDYENAKSLFETNVISREQFDLSRIGRDNAESGFIQARKALENTRLKAPFPGSILSRNLEIGDVVSPAGAMVPPFEIADLSSIKIIVSIPESRIGQLNEGQATDIRIKSLPDRVFSGQIHRIGLATQRLTNAFEVEIRLENTNQHIKLGMVADVSIIVNEWENAIVLPISIIHQGNEGSFVYLEKDNHASKRPIEILSLNGSNARVTGDIQPGDAIITHGHHDVRDGSKLSIIGDSQ